MAPKGKFGRISKSNYVSKSKSARSSLQSVKRNLVAAIKLPKSMYNFRKLSRGFRKYRKVRRGKYHVGGSRKFNQNVAEVVLDSLTADNSYVLQYADMQVTTGAATNSPAVGAMWAINQQASIGVGVGTQANLMIDNPATLVQIIANISNNKTTEMTRKSCEVECTITNIGTSNCELWEYRCKARRAQNATLDAVIQNGFADAQSGINTKPTYQTVGATPFQNPRFTSQYKVTRVKKWTLAPGEFKCIKYVAKKPRRYTMEELCTGAAGNVPAFTCLKGQRISLFAANGTFAQNDAANSSYISGISGVQLGMVYKVRYHYSWMNDVTIAAGTGNALAGFTLGSARVPMPVVTNHPESAINTVTYSGGAPVDIASGLRVVDASNTYRYTLPDDHQL